MGNLSNTYQDITRLDAPPGKITRDNLRTIEEIVNTTIDTTAFLYGLRVLSKHGLDPNQLDHKVISFNRRMPYSFRVERYYVEQDGNLIPRELGTNQNVTYAL